VEWSDSSHAESDRTSHATLLFGHTCIVAVAGVVANLQAFRRLLHLTTSPLAAVHSFLCWTAGNLFVGAQVGWVLRPYVCSPGIPVQFIRDKPFDGTFYESVFSSMTRVIGSGTGAWLFLLVIFIVGGTIARAALDYFVQAHSSNKSSSP
jgi:hypothetical protein